MATSPEQITAALSNSSAAGCVSRDTITAAVAPAMESSRKKCQGWKLARASASRRSVEVAEFVIESAFEVRRGGLHVAACAAVGRVVARPAHGKTADRH